MQDQPSTSQNSSEPPRSKTIPDDFIWDEETQGWYPPGEPCEFDSAEWQREFEEARQRGEFTGGLISVDQLREMGALDVPPEWRKSLGGGERRHLLPGFDDDDIAEVQESDEVDSEFDESAGEHA